jgi:hypothetical protein
MLSLRIPLHSTKLAPLPPFGVCVNVQNTGNDASGAIARDGGCGTDRNRSCSRFGWLEFRIEKILGTREDQCLGFHCGQHLGGIAARAWGSTDVVSLIRPSLKIKSLSSKAFKRLVSWPSIHGSTSMPFLNCAEYMSGVRADNRLRMSRHISHDQSVPHVTNDTGQYRTCRIM